MKKIIIIDDDEDNLAKARYAGFETARLDYRDDAELKKLNLHRDIDVVFCLFPDDADNVFLTISIKGLAPETPKLRLTPSLVVRAPMVASTGVWLPASNTVTVTNSLSVARLSSEARKVMS